LIFFLNLTAGNVFSQIEVVRTTVYNWSHAWENKDIDAYMSFYSRHFRSKGLDYDKWKAKKSLLFIKPCNLSVKISDLSVFVENRTAMASFIQRHYCGDYKDIGEKTLIFTNAKTGWKIISEEWKPVDKMHRLNRSSDQRKAEINQPLPNMNTQAIKATLPSILSEHSINEDITVQTGRQMDRIVIDISKFDLPAFSTVDGKTPGILIDIKNVSSWKGKPSIPVNGFLIKTIRTRFHRNLKKVTIILDLKPNEDYMINRVHYKDKKVLLIEVRKA